MHLSPVAEARGAGLLAGRVAVRRLWAPPPLHQEGWRHARPHVQEVQPVAQRCRPLARFTLARGHRGSQRQHLTLRRFRLQAWHPRRHAALPRHRRRLRPDLRSRLPGPDGLGAAASSCSLSIRDR
eukprot:scaffold21844_cov58-Phaeocystis_antarctica.AAC.3